MNLHIVPNNWSLLYRHTYIWPLNIIGASLFDLSFKKRRNKNTYYCTAMASEIAHETVKSSLILRDAVAENNPSVPKYKML